MQAGSRGAQVDRQHHRERGSSADPEQPGFGQRVAGHRLQQHTGRAQGEADQQGQFGTYPTQFEDDEAGIVIAAAEQGLQAGQDADVTRAQ